MGHFSDAAKKASCDAAPRCGLSGICWFALLYCIHQMPPAARHVSRHGWCFLTQAVRVDLCLGRQVIGAPRRPSQLAGWIPVCCTYLGHGRQPHTVAPYEAGGRLCSLHVLTLLFAHTFCNFVRILAESARRELQAAACRAPCCS